MCTHKISSLIVKIYKAPQLLENLLITEHTLHTCCKIVWWQSNLSASKSVIENIKKARKDFFAQGTLSTFQWDLNPCTVRMYNIFETCACLTNIIQQLCILATWLLLFGSPWKLPMWNWTPYPLPTKESAVDIGLHWSSISTHTIFTSLATESVFNASIVQQCRMLAWNLTLLLNPSMIQTMLPPLCNPPKKIS